MKDGARGRRSTVQEGEYVATVAEIILAMREAAPAGRESLAEGPTRELQGLTRELMAAMPDALAERERFDSIRERGVPLDAAELTSWLEGKTVLVTGGTGCIGSKLLAEVARYNPGRLVSVSRGLTGGWPKHARVDYLRGDVTNQAELAEVFGQARPDVVFHVAAQRDPGLAEREVQLTVSTNIFGTRNVVEAAARSGASEVICATSGKALRPYSREVYTAAKRCAEYVLARAAARGDLRVAAVRFTHVVDNSIVDDRLRSWARSGTLRIHDPATLFYAQSALESVQCMLYAGTGARRGALRIFTINDLGMPIGLLELAVGTLQQTGSASPVYLSGHDPGYETVAFPGLYDPLTAGDVSPLLSAFEAFNAEQDPIRGIDACTVALDLSRVPDDRLDRLEEASQIPGDQTQVRRALDELSWSVLDATLGALPQRALTRAARLTEPHEERLSPDHRKMLDAIRLHIAAGETAGPASVPQQAAGIPVRS
jgi:nucleoside-diphosphate-sugar epimerase